MTEIILTVKEAAHLGVDLRNQKVFVKFRSSILALGLRFLEPSLYVCE